MGLRATIQQNPAVGGAVAFALFVIAVWITIRQIKSDEAPRPSGQWFYNLGSGTLFVADLEAIPPIEAPGGGQAVRARVYGCGGCDEGDLKPAVLEKYPPQVVKTLQSPLPVELDNVAAAGYLAQRDMLKVDALLIATPPAQTGGEIVWAPQSSAEAVSIMQVADTICGDKTPQICPPQ